MRRPRLPLVAGLLLAWAPLAPGATEESAVSPPSVRVAAISFVPEKFNVAANVQRLQDAFRRAKAGGAEIAVGPEGVVEGYVVMDVIGGQAPAERMREVAQPIDSPVIQSFRQLAKELQMCLVFGFAERVGADVYNCAVFIDGQGRIRGQQHKMQLAEGYRDSWWFDRLGREERTFETPFGRCGILICNDRWNPALTKILALDGAQFLVIPSYGNRKSDQDETVLSRGRESSCPIVEANVGVTLIVDHNRIEKVDRQETGITFGQIEIPLPRKVDRAARDRAEQEFLAWRTGEMPKRVEKLVAKGKVKDAALP